MDDDRDGSSKGDHDVKMEDAPADVRMPDGKPTYKSWKKKYRKMRIVFDQKMHDGEDLHKLEQKALETARRLAVENDRLLDLLLDVNNSAQIPTERRFDLSLDLPPDSAAPRLEMDLPSTVRTGLQPGKSLKSLLQDVPHWNFAAAGERVPELLADLQAGRDSPADPSRGQSHPPTFLTADDIDNYIWEIDERLAKASGSANATAKNGNGPASPAGPRAASPLPTLAPLAQLNGNSINASANSTTGGRDSALAAALTSRDFAIRNPTSVYNWLRKHAPKTFLQDGEAAAAASADKENGHDDHHTPTHTGRGRGRGERGERGGGRGGGGSTRSKRVSAAHGRDKSAAAAESMEYLDDEIGLEVATPQTGAAGGERGGKGKRKRHTDDDPGYRPKGGSSRPAKRKRKSEGGDSTPTAPAPKRGLGRKASLGEGSARKRAERAERAERERERERDREMAEKTADEADDGRDD